MHGILFLYYPLSAGLAHTPNIIFGSVIGRWQTRVPLEQADYDGKGTQIIPRQ